ncbi:hypothetical protein PRECH8_25120 [Insulibacter thermoxylanivorax]|uniref:Uncharacterized protein n=1 Tax=Insulibacter thermoxylanivorax TaxID=2749268 RepID=A0A916VH42_9BACL|nr:hypothetical protein PRECH8_25120 [Insulibacter thermoxylanivorax]
MPIYYNVGNILGKYFARDGDGRGIEVVVSSGAKKRCSIDDRSVA